MSNSADRLCRVGTLDVLIRKFDETAIDQTLDHKGYCKATENIFIIFESVIRLRLAKAANKRMQALSMKKKSVSRESDPNVEVDIEALDNLRFELNDDIIRAQDVAVVLSVVKAFWRDQTLGSLISKDGAIDAVLQIDKNHKEFRTNVLPLLAKVSERYNITHKTESAESKHGGRLLLFCFVLGSLNRFNDTSGSCPVWLDINAFSNYFEPIFNHYLNSNINKPKANNSNSCDANEWYMIMSCANWMLYLFHNRICCGKQCLGIMIELIEMLCCDVALTFGGGCSAMTNKIKIVFFSIWLHYCPDGKIGPTRKRSKSMSKSVIIDFRGIRSCSQLIESARFHPYVSIYCISYPGETRDLSPRGIVDLSGPLSAYEDYIDTSNFLAEAGYDVAKYESSTFELTCNSISCPDLQALKETTRAACWENVKETPTTTAPTLNTSVDTQPIVDNFNVGPKSVNKRDNECISDGNTTFLSYGATTIFTTDNKHGSDNDRDYEAPCKLSRFKSYEHDDSTNDIVSTSHCLTLHDLDDMPFLNISLLPLDTSTSSVDDVNSSSNCIDNNQVNNNRHEYGYAREHTYSYEDDVYDETYNHSHHTWANIPEENGECGDGGFVCSDVDYLGINQQSTEY